MRIKAVLGVVALLAAACSGADGNGAAETPEVQVVQVSVEGSEYIFSPATVQAGTQVRLVFDPDNLPGCSRSVTVPEFDITKTIDEGDATIEFTPEHEGAIAVACTMNMYAGSLLAE